MVNLICFPDMHTLFVKIVCRTGVFLSILLGCSSASCQFSSCTNPPQYCGEPPTWSIEYIPVSREFVEYGSRTPPCQGFLVVQTSGNSFDTIVTRVSSREVICGSQLPVLDLAERNITSVAPSGLDCLFNQTFLGDSGTERFITGVNFSNNFIETLPGDVSLGNHVSTEYPHIFFSFSNNIISRGYIGLSQIGFNQTQSNTFFTISIQLEHNHLRQLPIVNLGVGSNETPTMNLYLGMSNNSITMLPDIGFATARISAQAYIALDYNQISSIDSAIYNFSGHKLYMQLSNNNITMLPTRAFSVPRVFSLVLLAAHNMIDISTNDDVDRYRAFENFLGALTLDLSDNGIRNISNRFVKNSIDEFSCVIAGLSLSLAHNNINFEGLQTIVQNIGNIGVPVYIDVRRNDITYIDSYTFSTLARKYNTDTFSGVDSGATLELHLEGNKLTAISPSAFCGEKNEVISRTVDNATTIMYFESLYVEIDNCSLSSMAPPVFDFSGIHIDHLNISAQYNNIADITWLTDAFKSFNTGVEFTSNGEDQHRAAQLTLHFAQNSITNGTALARGLAFQSSSVVANVNVSNNQISSLFGGNSANCIGWGFNISGWLDLSENSIAAVPPCAFAPTLVRINISNNNIGVLDGTPFQYNFNLKELVLDHNQLTYIDTSLIAVNPALQTLQVRFNNIKALPTENNNIADPLYLKGNEISCAQIGRNITTKAPYNCACKNAAHSLVQFCQYSYCSQFANGSMCAPNECVQRVLNSDECSNAHSSVFQPTCVSKTNQCDFTKFFAVGTEDSGCGTCAELKNCSSVFNGSHNVPGFESTPNTRTSDRFCTACRVCLADEVEQQPCTTRNQTVCVARVRKIPLSDAGIAGISVAMFVILICVIGMFWYFRRKQYRFRRRESFVNKENFKLQNTINILIARSKVDPDAVTVLKGVRSTPEMGAFGTIHSGVHEGRLVSVIRAHPKLPRNLALEYRDTMLHFAEHESNIVRIIGHFDFDSSQRSTLPSLLVPHFQYSLRSFLNSQDAQLWRVRERCILDIARGMKYLHSSLGLIHGNLTSTSCRVLNLDGTFVAKVFDLGGLTESHDIRPKVDGVDDAETQSLRSNQSQQLHHVGHGFTQQSQNSGLREPLLPNDDDSAGNPVYAYASNHTHESSTDGAADQAQSFTPFPSLKTHLQNEPWMDFTQLEDASKSGAVQYSQQTDIYSFGVIMWETVYNGLPFDAALEKCHSHEDRVGGILKTIINGGVHRFWNDCGKNDNDKKRSCPATFEEKMHDCLFHKAERRPAFNQLCADLENSQTWQIPFECVDFKLDGEQKRVALAKSANGLAFIGGLTLPGRGNRIEVVLREFSAVKFTNVSACVTKPKARHEPQAVEDGGLLATFCRDAEDCKWLDHGNLQKFYGAVQSNMNGSGTERGRIYLVTQYIERDLASALSVNALKDREIPKFAWEISKGMKYLHRAGFVHSSLRSAKCLIDEGGIIKIIVIGFQTGKNMQQGRIIPRRMSVAGSFKNFSRDALSQWKEVCCQNYEWRAPEVLKAAIDTTSAKKKDISDFRDILSRSKIDVYSFGVILWELLTSKKPYEEEVVNPVFQTAAPKRLHVSAKIASLLNELRKGNTLSLPKETESKWQLHAALMKKCLSLHPSGRPSFDVLENLLRPASHDARQLLGPLK
eukprot:m.1386844 g.1386844  ORF g.1386844 m.1386844 type:complete len:1668 (+) comp24977_c0_seq8:375-5378(+)